MIFPLKSRSWYFPKKTDTKILYAIQGTGYGHLSRAREVVPILQQFGEVHLLLSGCSNSAALPFLLDYDFRGLTFYPNASGGINYVKSLTGANPIRLALDIEKLPVKKYDLVLSDYEPVSAWSCQLKFKKCVTLSHQSAVMHPSAPKAYPMDPLAMALLSFYAPGTAHYGFHFQSYHSSISTPVIRSEVRNTDVADKGHYTVYLPAYSSEFLSELLKKVPDVRWEVFTKDHLTPQTMGNVQLMPLSNSKFIDSMSSASGILCGAGFETPSEALFLGKKLAVVPMKGQYEQQCNAAALAKMGITVFDSLNKASFDGLEHWVNKGKVIREDYPDNTRSIIERILDEQL